MWIIIIIMSLTYSWIYPFDAPIGTLSFVLTAVVALIYSYRKIDPDERIAMEKAIGDGLGKILTVFLGYWILWLMVIIPLIILALILGWIFPNSDTISTFTGFG